MRKVFFNKWFMLAFALAGSLSAFSFVASRGIEQTCRSASQCTQKPSQSGQKGEIFWDLISRQFASVSFQ
jgi:hypothetical protein